MMPAVLRFFQKKSTVNALLLLPVVLLFSLLLIAHRWDVPAEGDLGCFMGIAQHMHHGQWLYADVWDNKAPGVFLFHYLAQSLTQNPNYPVAITVFLCAIMAGSAYIRYRHTPPLLLLIASVMGSFCLLRLFVFWEVSYIGAFTEEWGILLMCSSWLLFDASEKAAFRIVSGLFFGLAVWVKEPFIVFYPAFAATIWYRYRVPQSFPWNWHLAAALPWLSVALLYATTGRLPSLLTYFHDAVVYASASPLSYPLFWTRFQALWNPYFGPFFLPVPLFFPYLLAYMGLRMSFFMYRRIRFKEIYFWGSLFTAWSFALIGSALFMCLGPQMYLHYAIPFLGVLGIGVGLCVFDVVFLLLGPHGKPLAPLPLLLLSYLTINRYLETPIQTRELPQGAIKERDAIRKVIPQNASVFVDFESGGRWYFYLNAHAHHAFPMPYAQFFYFEPNNQRDDVVRNRNLYKTQFLKHPPKYLISETDTVGASVFDYAKIIPWVSANYSLHDSIRIHGTSYYIRKKNEN